MTPVQRLARAVLLFYGAPEWDAAARAEWKALTDLDDATTKDLADLARKLLSEVGKPELYLIWSNERMAWWKLNRRGYTPSLAEAGRFSPAVALAICSHALMGTGHKMGAMPDLPVRLADVDLINTVFARDHPNVRMPWVTGEGGK